MHGPPGSLTLRRADALYGRALPHLPGGNTRSTVFVEPRPPYASYGHGCELIDADGRTLVDCLNNYTALVHGHARPEIVRAATEAIANGSCFGLPTEHEIELAERLAARVPTCPKWRFTNSGTEAVMIAVRLARAATGRSAVLRFRDSFHGSYDAAMQTPARGVPDSVASEVITVEVGDLDGLTATVERHGDRLAAVLFDAMPNRAGLRAADAGFVSGLRAQTRQHGILLIADEIISLRIAHGGMHSLYGIDPDIVTVGKLVGGGFPIGGVGGKAELMDLFDPRRPDPLPHLGTFVANPVSMVAGAVALDLLVAAEIERINSLGDRLRVSLAAAGWDVRGQGSLLQVRADDQRSLWWRLYGEGVLVAGNGLMCISTAMTDGDIDRVLGSFGRVAQSPGT